MCVSQRLLGKWSQGPVYLLSVHSALAINKRERDIRRASSQIQCKTIKGD